MSPATDEGLMQLIVLSNRKGMYLGRAVASIVAHVTGWTRITVVDDSGDPDWRAALDADPALEVVPVADDRAGYARAMAKVFELAEGDYFALWEEDFVAIAPIDLQEMAYVLDARQHLAQLAVLRQPWWTNEIMHGGVLEAKIAEGHEVLDVDGVLEHRAFFTCNPTVLPRRTFSQPWPMGQWSESRFGQTLLHDPEVRFGMLPGVRVEHVGMRQGFGY